MKKVRLSLLAAVLLLLLGGCGRRQVQDLAAEGPQVDPQGQLLCLVQEQGQAEEIAALYGISLVSTENGVAVFYTEEDPGTVIARGMNEGWPELSLNTLDEFA